MTAPSPSVPLYDDNVYRLRQRCPEFSLEAAQALLAQCHGDLVAAISHRDEVHVVMQHCPGIDYPTADAALRQFSGDLVEAILALQADREALVPLEPLLRDKSGDQSNMDE